MVQLIDGLGVSDSWKDKFKLIQEAEPIGFGIQSYKPTIGFVKFKNLESIISLPLIKKAFFATNILALLFSPIYYILKGMWKKGLIFWGLLTISYIFIPVGMLVIMTLAGGMANYDYYRFKVLDEGNFWW